MSRVLLVAAIVALQPVVPLMAQHTPTPLDPVRTVVSRRNAEADALESQATGLLRRAGGWREAAQLQRRAAELRGEDPRAIDSFVRAAWMYSGAGRSGSARQMMERAAEQAIARGDLERAVSALTDAAIIAAESEREDLVPGLVRRSRRLLESPLLHADQRARLLARVEGSPALARYARNDGAP
jgi:hypothetical protein